jgi:hypothetical protein
MRRPIIKQEQYSLNRAESEEEDLMKQLVDNSRLRDESRLSLPPPSPLPEHNLPLSSSSSSSSLGQQRNRREEEEELAASEELARQLLAEEALASYQQSVDFLRENADHFSQEDIAALYAALEEEDQAADGGHYVQMEGDEESVELSYDTLLRLGEQLGNVKEERWSMKSQEIIDQLALHFYTNTVSSGGTASSITNTNYTYTTVEQDDDTCVFNKNKCLICLHTYENGDFLRKLPCYHMFHRECIDPWLSTKDICPNCRQSIIRQTETNE